MKFVLAGNNVKKLAEMREILSGMDLDLISQKEAGFDLEVEETGKTFTENAFLKASAACRATGLPAISDDSGLVVEALDGAPGVHSKRYGPENLDDAGRCSLLLKNMQGVEHRAAKFVSTIICVFPNGDFLTATGECEGKILNEPRGSGGFGYDPVFGLEDGRSMAELPAEEKNKISHRGKALRSFSRCLSAYMKKDIQPEDGV